VKPWGLLLRLLGQDAVSSTIYVPIEGIGSWNQHRMNGQWTTRRWKKALARTQICSDYTSIGHGIGVKAGKESIISSS